MPADVAALVALDEVVVHGWDLARATGQPFEADDAPQPPAWASRSRSRFRQVRPTGRSATGSVPPDAELLDRLISAHPDATPPGPPERFRTARRAQ